MNQWYVKMNSKTEKEFKEQVSKGLFSKEDLIAIRKWMDEMEEHGPDYIAKSKLWDDHPLQYEWFGFRASCFSGAGRIIYKVKEHEIIIEVHRVTPSHNYRR